MHLVGAVQMVDGALGVLPSPRIEGAHRCGSGGHAPSDLTCERRGGVTGKGGGGK